MRDEQRDPCWRLVDLARLDADEPVLHAVDAPDAVLARKRVEPFDERHRIDRLSIERHRQTAIEADFDVSRVVGSFRRRFRPGINVLRRLDPGVFQHPRLDTASPEVLIDAVRAGLGDVDRDRVLLRVGDLGLAVHLPFPQGRDDLQVWRECLHRDIEPHLVVPLAGTSMCHRTRAFVPSDRDHLAGD